MVFKTAFEFLTLGKLRSSIALRFQEIFDTFQNNRMFEIFVIIRRYVGKFNCFCCNLPARGVEMKNHYLKSEITKESKMRSSQTTGKFYSTFMLLLFYRQTSPRTKHARRKSLFNVCFRKLLALSHVKLKTV